jgi:K+-sensing histidine kinase KdpD
LPTGKPDYELSLGEILNLTFNLYAKNFIVFFLPILIMMVLSGFLNAIVISFVNKPSLTYLGTEPHHKF